MLGNQAQWCIETKQSISESISNSVFSLTFVGSITIFKTTSCLFKLSDSANPQTQVRHCPFSHLWPRTCGVDEVDVPVVLTRLAKGLDPKPSVAASIMGSWMSLYMRCRALNPPGMLWQQTHDNYVKTNHHPNAHAGNSFWLLTQQNYLYFVPCHYCNFFYNITRQISPSVSHLFLKQFYVGKHVFSIVTAGVGMNSALPKNHPKQRLPFIINSTIDSFKTR